jgi:hydrogenase maturation protease
MGERPRDILLIGYGNPGRRDDGLGPALAAEIELLGLVGVTVDSDYQLTVEDAAAVARHELVVFADAAAAGPEPLSFERVEPKSATSFSSHSVEPAAVLALAQELFGSRAPGYCLGIRGYEFNVYQEQLSERARANLATAVRFIESVLQTGDFEQAAARGHLSVTGCAASSRDASCKTANM